MKFRFPCPKCGAPTYTYGDPLPGQYLPPAGNMDTREREHRACTICDWSSEPAKEATHD
jgi:predicted nucleic-acid-binding Zn-ribbon protein